MLGDLRLSERLYAALLRLYPASFRSAYGQQMRLTFRDACRDAYDRDGAGGLLNLWFPTLLDLFKSALEERARRGEIIMFKERFIGLAGPLTIVVGSLMMAGLVGDLVWLVTSSEPVWEFFHFGLGAVSIVLMLPAFVATRLCYQQDAHGLGRLGLLLNVAGSGGLCLMILVGYVLNALEPEPVRHDLLNFVVGISALSILVGHILFGIYALRYRLLPRWNAAPLLVGLTAPLVIALSVIAGAVLGKELLPFGPTIMTLLSSITGLWWILMGFAMMSQRSVREAAAD